MKTPKRNSPERQKETDEWGTPPWLFNELNSEANFVLDVCASEKNHKCDEYYDIEKNGLAQNWLEDCRLMDGGNWYCNPPYSKILPWAEKGSVSVSRCVSGYMLVKFDPSVRHGNIFMNEADELRIIKHRFGFEGAPHVANFPCAIAVFRKRLFTRKTGAKIFIVDYRDVMYEAICRQKLSPKPLQTPLISLANKNS